MEIYSIAATAWLSPSLSPSVMQYGTSIPATHAELAAIARLQMRADDAGQDSPPRTRQNQRRRTARSKSRSKSPKQPPPPRFISGTNPNIHWRAISTEELRSHPRVIGLPPADGVQLAGPKSFHWVRQDDPLWDDLHEGVLTSRHLLSALGMREERAASICGFPRACSQTGAIGHCWNSLRRAKPPPGRLTSRSVDELQAAESSNAALRDAFVAYRRADQTAGGALGGWPPRADGLPTYLDEDVMEEARFFGSCKNGIGLVRRSWGSAQEAAALAAFIEDLPEEANLEEIGLAMASEDLLPNDALKRMHSKGQLPPLGASPDCMLRPTPEGPLEVVEVKNVCPFWPLNGAKGGYGVYHEYISNPDVRSSVPFWRLRGPHDQVPTQYVPQVMVEMLVTGAPAANYVSCSATQGINVFRVERDDEYLSELLHFLGAFWSTVQNNTTPPADDFFWSPAAADALGGMDKDKAVNRYKKFLSRTRQIGKKATVSRHIANPFRREASGVRRRFFVD